MNALTVHEKLKTDTKLEQIAALYTNLKANGDMENASKMLDIYVKMQKQELIISFAGHFSAGKSSMINKLLGEDILPRSPIPTSANVVKISSGEGVARVYFTTGSPAEYKEPYDIDRIKEFSKDKEAIKRIEISTGKQILPDAVAIVDTPGIDAADDADRIITESSLHLADVLFYMMDYNHVQSEVNLQFLKSVQEKSLPYYIVINQIDKHDERELAFKSFDTKIKQTFDQWNLLPKGIYYTSLLEENVPHNQFPKIKLDILEMIGDHNQHLRMDESVGQIIKEHKQFLTNVFETKKQNLIEFEMEQDEFANEDDLTTLQKKLHDLENEPQRFEQDFMMELQQTLNNAYLMPAALREKAWQFLESQQSDFKVGLFGSKRKTEEEKENRLSSFLYELTENVKTSVQWKLRDKFLALLKKYELTDAGLQKKINELEIIYGAKDLMDLIKGGATVNGDYILNYTNDVAGDIKAKYRKLARSVLKSIQAYIIERNKVELEKYKERLDTIKSQLNVQQELTRLESEKQKAFTKIDSQFIAPNVDESAWNVLKQDLDKRPKPVRQKLEQQDEGTIVEVEKNTIIHEVKSKSVTREESMDVLASIQDVLETVQDLPGFKSLIRDLKVKAERLTNRSYTIALFGAFSAGKSSFANALMGEKVLPVSPNPTTATVNRICPVDEENKHGTIVVTLKDEKQLAHDLQMITKRLEPKANEFKELMTWVKTNKIDQHKNLNKMYQSYLQAMIKGYKDIESSIGKTITIKLDEFEAFVTDETKACYIEAIDLYYDCALTRQGVTLVDTPGADSVNARHTNVAFDYIKQADAILYVTYYNHALSRADKDFLMQLGRVKESFQLDKMFFIVNAADLAEDDTELQLVTEYVQDQLQHLGIRIPRLYPVSSKLSLEDKLQGKSLNKQMTQLEKDFYQFIYHDLSILTIDSAIWDMHRTQHALNNYVTSLNMDQQQKENRKNDLLAKKAQLFAEIHGFSTTVYEQQIKQRIEKQVYYVLERLTIRYHDMFKEMFNPTTITESGRRGQDQLKNSLDNLLEYIGFELHQELQAISLRVESLIKTQLQEIHQNLVDKSMQFDPLFQLPNLGDIEIKTPEYEQGLSMIDIRKFQQLFSTYKGTKAFFVNNEKEFMKEEIYVIIRPYAEQYLESNKLNMSDAYHKQWKKSIEQLKINAKAEIESQLHNYLQMLVTVVDMEVLLQRQEHINAILKQYNKEEVS